MQAGRQPDCNHGALPSHMGARLISSCQAIFLLPLPLYIDAAVMRQQPGGTTAAQPHSLRLQHQTSKPAAFMPAGRALLQTLAAC